MKFIATFEDNEAKAQMRQQHMAAHLAFLESNRDSIDAAGPLFRAGSGEGAGGIWIVDAAAEEDVHALVRSDPFRPTGLRQRYTVLGWTQVFANGKRLIDPS